MTMANQLLNSVKTVVDDCLKGLVLARPSLHLVPDSRVVVRADLQEHHRLGRVSIVSGGGAGHEPVHSGYVGAGMLTAAVSGDVFASPPSTSILAALRTVASDAGTLLVVHNYTGDRLTFGLALERALAEGLRVCMVIVADDMAFDLPVGTAGRRGLAGALFVLKVSFQLCCCCC